VRQRLLGHIDDAAALDGLSWLSVNYDQTRSPDSGFEAADGHWHVDCGATQLGEERPGAPEQGGLWESACRLVGQYEFADARILRGVYRRDSALLGRNLLLEGRFFALRFYLGVRVTRIIDEERDADDEAGQVRVWGWQYQTLQGHLEQGRLSYEIIKNLATGLVTFKVAGYSRRAPIANPLIRAGFVLFGRWTQQRFYRNIQLRMADLTRAAQRGRPLPSPLVRNDGIVLAPSGARPRPLDLIARGWLHPGS
jgi:uncharacterized protein (UPF0548 family)